MHCTGAAPAHAPARCENTNRRTTPAALPETWEGHTDLNTYASRESRSVFQAVFRHSHH
jgi:hypothetical protein